MRALIQRVNNASVEIDKKIISEIENGLLVFICAMSGDKDQDSEKMALKIAKMRIFSDENGKINKSILDIDSAEILVVSQFTLSADTSRGNRPGFSSAATPEIGEGLYEKFVIDLQKLGIKCKKGVFGGDMQVSLTNDGPTTIWIDSNSS